MKVRETRVIQQPGFGAPLLTEERVRELEAHESLHPNAEVVGDSTPVADWKKVD